MCKLFTMEELNKLHTKQLLNELRRTYYYNDFFCSECDGHNCIVNREHIKSVLSGRPHIMNKKESKEYRKLRIKIGK